MVHKRDVELKSNFQTSQIPLLRVRRAGREVTLTLPSLTAQWLRVTDVYYYVLCNNASF